MKRTELQFAVCVKNKRYAASLELRKLYQVVADEAATKLRQIRVIDEDAILLRKSRRWNYVFRRVAQRCRE